ncbi:MAG: Crp/Fnr family transcriptional regulator [Clostridiales bacterium]|nr:Crp/Fnr family transcriptional regulator [Clostridiales bacterium]
MKKIPREQEILQNIGTILTLPAGRILYMKGDPADRIYYLLEGRIRVFENIPSGREVTLDMLGSGHIVGESAFVKNGLRPTCVQAVTDVRLISCRISDLLPCFASDPAFALYLLRLCSDSMDRLVARLRDQCLLDRYGKIANFILDVTKPGSHGDEQPMTYTHEGIATALGLNRSSVTMVLRDFCERGWLENKYGRIYVRNRKELEDFIERQKIYGNETSSS